MANLVTGAMGSLIPKLGELLKEEYNLQTGMKNRIKSLTLELESAKAALRKVEMVPWDQLDEQVQIWARQVREASYDMEDVLDTFLVGVQGPDSTKQKSLLKRLGKKITSLLTKRNISVNSKDIMSHLEEVTERCGRFKVGDIAVAMPDTASTVDPRLHAMYNKVEDHVGIDKSSGELISILQSPQQEGASNLKTKIVSIVGVGGLGKTTLAKVVYDKLKGDFNYGAFVPVGRNPDLKKVLKDILMDLDKQRRLQLSAAVLDERQLIDELRLFLKNRRPFSPEQERRRRGEGKKEKEEGERKGGRKKEKKKKKKEKEEEEEGGEGRSDVRPRRRSRPSPEKKSGSCRRGPGVARRLHLDGTIEKFNT